MQSAAMIGARASLQLCFVAPALPFKKPGLVSCPAKKAQTKSISSLRASSQSSPPTIRQLSPPRQRFYDFSNHVVQSIRLTHCRVLSSEMATVIERTIRSKAQSLSEMARLLSVFEPTRNKGGDAGWLHLQSSAIESKLSHHQTAWTDELLAHALTARPGALQITKLSYAWEVYTVTDVRHGLRPSLGRSRTPGNPINFNMRRNSPKKPAIDPLSYYIQTFGCQMNASDSERMAAHLEQFGYHAATDPTRSSVYILNTCALRDHAEQKVYSYLGEHAQRKWDAPHDVTLVVAGCVAQQEGDKLLARVPEVDVVMGPQYANRVGEVLQEFTERKAQIVAVDPIHIQEDISQPKRTSRVTAWVNIIYGCLEKCSYCVVPNTRGLEQSRTMDGIRKEVEALAAEGYKEVVLLGQNVDAYGRDLSPKSTLSDLLRHIHDVEGLERIRFTTGHPRYISENLIKTVAELPKVMEHFVMPPQSGDNKVLKEMGRGYTRERYLQIAKRVRERIPDASICADMIVGFPGETDEAFQGSVSLAEEVVFDANMVRAYSARPGTTAAERKDQVEEDVKAERLGIMNRLMRKQAEMRSRRFLGRVVEVLIEGENEKVKGEVMGRERTNRVVFLEGGAELIGRLVMVNVYEAFAFSLRGTLVSVVR